MRKPIFSISRLRLAIRWELIVLGLGVSHGATLASDLNDLNSLPRVSLSGKLQAAYGSTNVSDATDIPGNFYIRRARIKVDAKTSPESKFVLQSNYSTDARTGAGELKIIDAYLAYELNDHTLFTLGQHVAPALRQNITQAGALLAIDRPSVTYKSITWGTRSRAGFTTLSSPSTDAGLRGDTGVRDVGISLMARHSQGDDFHWKTYIGAYNGVSDGETPRYTARMQANIGDSENSYYNSAYYHSDTHTVSLGLSLDHQGDVTLDSASGQTINYDLASVDVFTQQSLYQGSLSFEAAYIFLDLDDADLLLNPITGAALNSTSASAAQGQGYYAQAAFELSAWQPWIMFEHWTSDDVAKLGSFTNIRIGLTRFINSSLECKVGIERWEADGDERKSLTTFVAGAYLRF